MPYLLKTEPESYSFDDLRREHETDWTGVTNPQAVKTLREMKHGDALVIYHTGKEKAAVGEAKVIAVDANDPRTPRVRIVAGQPLPAVKTLAAMREEPLFADSPLLRQGRLSVVPLTAEQYAWLTRA